MASPICTSTTYKADEISGQLSFVESQYKKKSAFLTAWGDSVV